MAYFSLPHWSVPSVIITPSVEGSVVRAGASEDSMRSTENVELIALTEGSANSILSEQKERTTNMAKFRQNAEVDFENEEIDPAGDSDSDTESTGKKEKSEAPKPKLVKKKVKVTEDSDQTETKPKAAKKAAKAKTNGSEKKERKERKTILSETGLPYGAESMIGKAFLMARKGVSLDKLKKFIEENKETKKGGNWVITRLRSGHRHDNKVTWKVMEENGVLKVGEPKAAA